MDITKTNSAVASAASDFGSALAGAAPEAHEDHPRLEDDVRSACGLIAPLWTLRNFVAVNPYMGWTDLPFADASQGIGQVFHSRTTMPIEYYAEQLSSSRIDHADLLEAAREALQSLPLGRLEGKTAEEIVEEMLALVEAPERADQAVAHPLPTYAEYVDRTQGSDWSSAIVNALSGWLSGYFDAGQAAWPEPGRDLPLLRAWRESAMIDRSLELQGLDGFREFVRALPRKPLDVIAHVLDLLAVPKSARRLFLARQLASVAGWAGHLNRRARESAAAGHPESLTESLLAIRLAHDGALAAALGSAEDMQRFGVELRVHCEDGDERCPEVAEERELLMLWHRAYELRFRRGLLHRLEGPARPSSPPAPKRPTLQAVFCIDVRSEILRRHLEAMDPGIQTIGFAGFFGMPIALERLEEEGQSPLCPVLLQPSHRIREVDDGSGLQDSLHVARARHRAFTRLRKLAVGTFPLVETLGQLFGPRLLSDSLGWTHPRSGGTLLEGPREASQPLPLQLAETEGGFGIALDDRVALAEGALRNMGLSSGFAPVVLLCGHGSSASNNPYASALDCGACGGHSGDTNARVASAILNDPDVRRALLERGIAIPEDTVFVAGLHDTTRDRVSLMDANALPAEQRARIERWLEVAGGRTSDERAPRLGERFGKGLGSRATDWSEVRPEWGLAGNAAFIAAPRRLTRGLDLEGRCFLHDYDEAHDEEGAVLELILTAPLVVASWINLQYFASTVDNDVFGSGDKTIHNVTGRHGVVLGNGGDLKTGLPWQSVHDGGGYVHEPMRLTAVVRASESRIEAVLAAHDDLRLLVENQWVHLIRWDPEASDYHHRCGEGRGHAWRRLEVDADPFEDTSVPAVSTALSCPETA